MNWNEYFEMLKDWKKLPAYKAEPRIDCLIGHYLPQILSNYLNVKVKGIIPELPIRLGTIKPTHEGTVYADRSYKVDFLAITENGVNYLVEFKTDSGSRRVEQDLYLQEAKMFGTKAVVDGIIKISNVSSYRHKYDHLKNKLLYFGLIDHDNNYTGLNPDFEVVYVQPSNMNLEKFVIDFKWISEWLKSNYANSEFETELANTLYTWSNN